LPSRRWCKARRAEGQRLRSAHPHLHVPSRILQADHVGASMDFDTLLRRQLGQRAHRAARMDLRFERVAHHGPDLRTKGRSVQAIRIERKDGLAEQVAHHGIQGIELRQSRQMFLK